MKYLILVITIMSAQLSLAFGDVAFNRASAQQLITEKCELSQDKKLCLLELQSFFYDPYTLKICATAVESKDCLRYLANLSFDPHAIKTCETKADSKSCLKQLGNMQFHKHAVEYCRSDMNCLSELGNLNFDKETIAVCTNTTELSHTQCLQKLGSLKYSEPVVAYCRTQALSKQIECLEKNGGFLFTSRSKEICDTQTDDKKEMCFKSLGNLLFTKETLINCNSSTDPKTIQCFSRLGNLSNGPSNLTQTPQKPQFSKQIVNHCASTTNVTACYEKFGNILITTDLENKCTTAIDLFSCYIKNKAIAKNVPDEIRFCSLNTDQYNCFGRLRRQYPMPEKLFRTCGINISQQACLLDPVGKNFRPTEASDKNNGALMPFPSYLGPITPASSR